MRAARFSALQPPKECVAESRMFVTTGQRTGKTAEIARSLYQWDPAVDKDPIADFAKQVAFYEGQPLLWRGGGTWAVYIDDTTVTVNVGEDETAEAVQGRIRDAIEAHCKAKARQVVTWDWSKKATP